MDEDRITGAAKKVAGKIEGGIGDLTGDAKTQLSGRAREAGGTVENLVGQAKDAARTVADQASELADQAYDSGRRYVEQGRRYVDEGRQRYPEAERYYRDGTEMVSRRVEESPLAAIMIAGAVGYVLALLLHRR